MATRLDFSVSNGKPRKPQPARPTKAERDASTRKAKHRERLAYVCGGAGLALLSLSGWDCTLAISGQTGMPIVRAAMLAVAIDCGVCCAAMAELFSHGHPAERTITRWTRAYIILAGLLSVILNAVEFASHAQSGMGQALNAVLGATIPVLSLIAERFTGHLWLSAK